MTITLLAPDGVAITAQQERQAKAPLYGNGTLRTLGGRSGFRVGTDITTLVATTTQWTLKPFSAMIDAAATFHQGMYGVASDADITGPMTAADATYDRKDIVYIQINDSSAGDGSGATNATVTYVAGTPTATPVAPTLPVRSFLVGTITVPKVSGGSPTVALNTARFVASGGILPVYSQAERDALSKYDGLTVRRMDLTGRPHEAWDEAAAAWGATRSLDPLDPSGFNVTGKIFLEAVGSLKRVTVDVTMTRTSGAFSVLTGPGFMPLGTILPSAARGVATGADAAKYFGVVLTGNGMNNQASMFVNTSTGDAGIKSFAAFDWLTSGLFSLNFVYYI